MRGPGDRASRPSSSLVATLSAMTEANTGQTKTRPAEVGEFGTRTKSLLHENRETSGGSAARSTSEPQLRSRTMERQEATGRREP